MSAALARAAARPKPLRVALIIAVLGALPAPVATVDAAEPCPNEQVRQESNSTQLPDCRAYELVSPPNAGGAVGENLMNNAFGLGEGNLAAQLASPVNAQANGSVAFWMSTATPPGSGAIEDGQSPDTFRSVRTAGGWSVRDLLPSGQLANGTNALVRKGFLGASTDGSVALIGTVIALTPGAYADPTEAESGVSNITVIYRVTAGGGPPQMVTRFDRQIPPNEDLPSGIRVFLVLSASPQLDEVAFSSGAAMDPTDTCNGATGSPTVYLWNASSETGLARPIVNFNGQACTAPNIAGVPTILPNGDPILMPNTSGNPFMPSMGPVVETSPQLGASGSGGELTSLSGPSGATLLSTSPGGATAYVQSQDALDPRVPNAANLNNIYAMTTASGVAGPVTCVSCGTDQVNVTYLATSQNGTHVLFTTDEGLWEWDALSGAQLLTQTPVTDLGPQSVVMSTNGQYIVGLTSQLVHNPNGTADLYEFSAGQVPRLITSGASADGYSLYERNSLAEIDYVATGVSNDGSRVVYNRAPTGGAPTVIDEWVAGQTYQISPPGSQNPYSVATVAGDELENVFFMATEPLVPWDDNGGQADIYDARVGGGFPAPTEPVDNSESPDPIGPTTPPYTGNLAPLGEEVAPLPPNTSSPASAKAKPLTRTQKLAKALKACREKPKKRRAACRSQVRKNYGPVSKKAKKTAWGGN